MTLIKRLERLEQRAINTSKSHVQNRQADTAKVCRETIEAIDAGHIYDYQGKDATNYLSPTSNHEYFGLRYEAEQLVKWWAERTGWHSPTGQGWKAYRANTAAEMRAVMSEILELLQMFEPYSVKEIEDMIGGRRPFPGGV